MLHRLLQVLGTHFWLKERTKRPMLLEGHNDVFSLIQAVEGTRASTVDVDGDERRSSPFDPIVKPAVTEPKASERLAAKQKLQERKDLERWIDEHRLEQPIQDYLVAFSDKFIVSTRLERLLGETSPREDSAKEITELRHSSAVCAKSVLILSHQRCYRMNMSADSQGRSQQDSVRRRRYWRSSGKPTRRARSSAATKPSRRWSKACPPKRCSSKLASRCVDSLHTGRGQGILQSPQHRHDVAVRSISSQHVPAEETRRGRAGRSSPRSGAMGDAGSRGCVSRAASDECVRRGTQPPADRRALLQREPSDSAGFPRTHKDRSDQCRDVDRVLR